MCGKSRLILDLVDQCDRVFERPVFQFVYVAPKAFTADQDYVQELATIVKKNNKKLHVLENLPTVAEVLEIYPEGDRVLIVDDITTLPNLEGLTELAGYGSHHTNLSLVYSLQNPYQRTKKTDLVSVSRNLTGRFIFYQLNDLRLFRILNDQLFPTKPNFIIDSLDKARDNGLKYIFVNTHPQFTLHRDQNCYTALFKEKDNTVPFLLHYNGRVGGGRKRSREALQISEHLGENKKSRTGKTVAGKSKQK